MGCIHSKSDIYLNEENDLSEDMHLRSRIQKDIKTCFLKARENEKSNETFEFDCPCMKRKEYSSEMVDIRQKQFKTQNYQQPIPGMYIQDQDLFFSPDFTQTPPTTPITPITPMTPTFTTSSSSTNYKNGYMIGSRSVSCPNSFANDTEEKKGKRNIYINTCESPKIRQVTPCYSRNDDNSKRNSWQSYTSSEEWHTPRKHNKEDDICCHVSRDVHDNTFTFSYDPDLIENIYVNYERIRSHSL